MHQTDRYLNSHLEQDQMCSAHFALFGKLEMRLNGRHLVGCEARKLQELLCYLLLYRDRPHYRETLAAVLWSDSTTAQSKKYLCQALWQLQAALTEPCIKT